MHDILSFVSDNFETIVTILGSTVVGASALCAFIPGHGLIKRVLAILALNIKNATPEDIAKVRKVIESAKEISKPEKEKK